MVTSSDPVLESPRGGIAVSIKGPSWALDALSRDLGWPLLHGGSVSPASSLEILPSLEDEQLSEACSILADKRYLVCERESAISLYHEDGEVTYDTNASSTRVRLFGDRPSEAPAIALESAFFRALACQGILALHAVSFRIDGIGVLALGPSQVGKSTLGLSALLAGAELVSDDRVALMVDGDGMGTALSLRDFMQIRVGTLRGISPDALPEFMVSEIYTQDVYRLGVGEHPGFSATYVPIDQIWLLSAKDRGEASRIERISQAQAFAGLLASSFPYLFAGKGKTATGLIRTAQAALRRSAVAEVGLGREMLTFPVETVKQVIGQVAARSI